MPIFIALGTYFISGTKFFWNELIDTCFNVEYVLLGCNFHFLGGYLEVTVRYLMVTACYCSLPGGYSSLLVVTARYRSLLIVPTFTINVKILVAISFSVFGALFDILLKIMLPIEIMKYWT